MSDVERQGQWYRTLGAIVVESEKVFDAVRRDALAVFAIIANDKLSLERPGSDSFLNMTSQLLANTFGDSLQHRLCFLRERSGTYHPLNEGCKDIRQPSSHPVAQSTSPRAFTPHFPGIAPK